MAILITMVSVTVLIIMVIDPIIMGIELVIFTGIIILPVTILHQVETTEVIIQPVLRMHDQLIREVQPPEARWKQEEVHPVQRVVMQPEEV